MNNYMLTLEIELESKFAESIRIKAPKVFNILSASDEIYIQYKEKLIVSKASTCEVLINLQ